MSRASNVDDPAASAAEPLDLAAAAALAADVVVERLKTAENGLTSAEAARRRAELGANVLATHRVTALGVLIRQLHNPLLILLLAAAGISAVTGDRPTAGSSPPSLC